MGNSYLQVLSYGWYILSVVIAPVNAHTGFVNTKTSKKYAAWSILAKNINGTLTQTIGTVQKHRSNPLLIQDKPWEMRLDNAYPNVVKTNAAYQLWYGGFIAGKHFDTSEGRDRVNGFHYANSTDGLTWNKPALGIFDLGKSSK